MGSEPVTISPITKAMMVGRCAFEEDEKELGKITLLMTYNDGMSGHIIDIYTVELEGWRCHDVRRFPRLLSDSEEWIEVVWLTRCPDAHCRQNFWGKGTSLTPWSDERNPEGCVVCDHCGGIWNYAVLEEQTKNAYHGTYCDRRMGHMCFGCQDA